MNDYPFFRSPEGREAVTADLTASVAELAFTRHAGLGKAVDLTFRTLGIDRVTRPPEPSDLLVIGSAARIADRLPDLRKAIGIIAKKSADTTFGTYASYQSIGDTLDTLTQRTIPNSLNQSGAVVVQVVGEALSEFGDLCNDDGCGVDYGKRVGWYAGKFQEHAQLGALPYYVLENVLAIEQLEPGKKKDTSRDAALLRRRASRYLLEYADDAPKLKKGSHALRDFEQKITRDATALQRVKARFAAEPGKAFDELILPEDIIHQLLDEELTIMGRESA